MAEIAFVCGQYMAWVFARGDNAVMAGGTDTDDGYMIYPAYAVESDGVMAVFTYLCA